MHVIVDRTLCEDNGICVGAAPDVFDLDEDGKLVIVDADPAESHRRAVEDAVMICPVQALSINEK